MDIVNLEYWMTNLPQQLRQMPFVHLAIPGSHDSMTAAITRSSTLSPDAEAILKRLNWLGPILRSFMYKWCRTQTLSGVEQLKQGIRYFDFRVASKENTVNHYFVHGLYSNEVTSTLSDFRDFIDTHPEEVIIMDFQHFYAFKNEDHRNLINTINTIFKYKLLPKTKDMKHLTLEFMTRTNKYQVIVIYRNGHAHEDPFLWMNNSFPTPWPATTSSTELIQKLDYGLAHRIPSIGYVSQFLLTPTNWFVFKHIYSSLKKQCVIPLQKTKCEWISRQMIGGHGVNIIIGDFIELNNSQFSSEVIRLNLKSLSIQSSTLTPVD
ncbi:hypothetical protein RN001_013459 [Aquatica leii]|uniref:Phosphatidylinositol-specific phospholipase C X domain-containing protein n=1 Tax=Aquatica leii TaxID=1421715 RepID=A0AAN7PQM8_9COLE|nr:hypothetical protein RN001_013459 [Aquatica leii]